jgi:hypothetical protein
MSDLITPGKNTAVFDRVEIPQDIERSKKANYWLERAGQTLEPPGCEYLGSATIHYYKVKSLDDKVRHSTVSQLTVRNVVEQLADWGYKELGKALMRTFGREVKE